MIGEVLAKYRVEARIGSGGNSRVYSARHTWSKNRLAAIKVFHDYVDTHDAQEKFEQEVQYLRRLRHQHIVPIIGHGIAFIKSEDMRLPYLVTELASYGSLRDLINQDDSPFPAEQAMAILLQVGSALQYAHDSDVAHLDIKPENILFSSPDQVWLADFGIAVILTATRTREGGMAGTYAYMAPEQYKGKMSKKSDQYALACIAYELLTGHRPFEANTAHELMHQHMHKRPYSPDEYNPDIPTAACDVILKALAKQTKNRYETVAEFLAELNYAMFSDDRSTRRNQENLPSNYPGGLAGYRLRQNQGPASGQRVQRGNAQPPLTRRASRSVEPKRQGQQLPAPPRRQLPPYSRMQQLFSSQEFISIQPSTYLRQHSQQPGSDHWNWSRAGYLLLAPIMFVMAFTVYLFVLINPARFSTVLLSIDCLCLFVCLIGDAFAEIYRNGRPLWTALSIAVFIFGIAGTLITFIQHSANAFFCGMLPVTFLSVLYRWQQSS